MVMSPTTSGGPHLLTIFYNILQAVILVTAWPLLFLVILASPKYRKRIPQKLGFGLAKNITVAGEHSPTFWIHALSVGEVTSAIPLISKLRDTYSQSRIIVTCSTSTGQKLASERLKKTADLILPSPIDLLPSVKHYIHCIQPDFFILVETDFWPNLLHQLQKQQIPILLVNGRISEKSFQAYQRYSFFFQSMFESFSALCLQTDSDKENLKTLGISPDRLHTLGNLKFDTPQFKKNNDERFNQLLPQDKLILTAGSTHQGEEEIIIETYGNLKPEFPQLFLILVPRNPKRCVDLIQLCDKYNMSISLRSEATQPLADILLVDTIGELVKFYSFSHIGYVGGSLVSEGGHNPIEPAAMSIPVVYGPHMEDFQEIAKGLIAAGGAREVHDMLSLRATLTNLITDSQLRNRMGEKAFNYVAQQQGVVQRHLQLIDTLL